MSVDWTQLPGDLLVSISQNFKLYADYLRFRAVCRRWQSAVPEIPRHLPPQLPLLILPASRTHPTHRGVFDLSTQRLHFLYLPQCSTIPPNVMRHRGSSEGWLVLMGLSPDLILVNPLSRLQLHLPPLFTVAVTGLTYLLRFEDVAQSFHAELVQGLEYMRDRLVKKVVLSSSPSKDPNFVAVAILYESRELAYCGGGVHSWSMIEDAAWYSEDVIYFKGAFYAVSLTGRIAVCDLTGAFPQVSFIRPQEPVVDNRSDYRRYLVGSGEELFLVSRLLAQRNDYYGPGFRGLNTGFRTYKFNVWRLNWSVPAWEEVRSLGDETLFLGINSSLSVRASDFPGCMANCIYFTDEFSEKYRFGVCMGDDLGIYNLGDGSIQKFPTFFSHTLPWPPPIWFSPNP